MSEWYEQGVQATRKVLYHHTLQSSSRHSCTLAQPHADGSKMYVLSCLKSPPATAVLLTFTGEKSNKSFRQASSTGLVLSGLSTSPAHTAASSGCGWKGRSYGGVSSACLFDDLHMSNTTAFYQWLPPRARMLRNMRHIAMQVVSRLATLTWHGGLYGSVRLDAVELLRKQRAYMTQKITWQTESVRLTLLGSIENSPSFSWSALTGQQPESVTSRPNQQIHVEEGLWENGQLSLNSQPGRVEVIFSAVPTDPSSMPTLGEFSEVLPKFEALALKAKIPLSVRIAIGVRLNAVLGDQASSDRLIGEVLPHVKLPENSTDVVFQYNVPKKFPKISGIVVNRIVKWSQLVAHTLQFVGGQPHANVQEHILQLDLDLNTSPLSKLPHPDQYGLVLKALFGEAASLSASKVQL